MIRDQNKLDIPFQLSLQKHHYGPQVRLLANPYLHTLLAQLCSESTRQPAITSCVERISLGLLEAVINAEFPRRSSVLRSRMIQAHPVEGEIEQQILDRDCRVVTVNLARAGTVPSQVSYHALNQFMNPDLVRQDHISIARQTSDQTQAVTGSAISGHKIGGTIDDAIVLIPDPMGATGSTLIETLGLYRTHGRAKKIIAIHYIVTPEYLKKVTTQAPELTVYALRLDRGLSAPHILSTELGQHWDQEKGLNDQSYIVPGGGGFGEIMNNAFV